MNLLKKKIGSVTIEYVDVGQENSRVIVFAHGLGSHLKQWTDQIHHFKKEYRVIAFSLQGHGGSSATEDASIEGYAEIVDKLLEIINVKSCVWIGNSLGGVIGFELLKCHPERIEQLIINGTAPKLTYSNWALKLILWADHLLIKWLGYERYVMIASNASLKNKEKRLFLKELFLAAQPSTIIRSHQILGNYDYLEVLHSASINIVLIMAPNDKDINKNIQPYKKALEARDHIEFVMFDFGGHILNIEYPDAYNDELMKHLRKTEI